MKRIVSLVIIAVMMLSLAACGAEAQPETGEMNEYVLSGPTGIGAVNLWAKAEAGETKNT